MRWLWKPGTPFQSKTGNQLSSWDDMGCMELSSSWCTEINIHIDLRLVPLVLYDVEHGISMEPMKGKWASSRVDLGYPELFCIPEVTAVFLSSCDRFPGYLSCSIKHIEAPYVFDWEHGIALHQRQGIQALTLTEGDVSWDF